MKEKQFNLVRDAWLPVLMRDGRRAEASLATLFSEAGGEITDLVLNVYERIAVTRFLLCICQAAIGEADLADEKAWHACRDGMVGKCAEYLKRWEHKFNLFGQGAFLQLDNLELGKNDPSEVGKLFFHLSTGNNKTLYDHEALSEHREITLPRLAVGLITFQSYSAGGLCSRCVWDCVQTAGSVRSAPCRERSMLITLLSGSNLHETLWLNLFTSEMMENLSYGKPVWEYDDYSRNGLCALAQSLQGRLMPLPRALKLNKVYGENESVFGRDELIMGEALLYPQHPESRELMATVKLQKQDKTMYLYANPERMPWRDLTSVLALRTQNTKIAGAVQLGHLATLRNSKSIEFTLWIGGLQTDKSKELDVVEWSTTMSTESFDDLEFFARYEESVNLADVKIGRIRDAVKTYAQFMKQDSGETYRVPAERYFWDCLAQEKNQSLLRDTDRENYKEDWNSLLRNVAREAYERACPTETPRQVEAFVAGLRQLMSKPVDKNSKQKSKGAKHE